ncbi:MAG: AI-2E family transporter [Planctomycetota bacterium]
MKKKSSKRKRKSTPESSQVPEESVKRQDSAATPKADPPSATDPPATSQVAPASSTSQPTPASSPLEPLGGKMPSLSRITSVAMLLLGILLVGVLFYKVMAGFFIPLFMAAALVVIFRPVNEWLLERLRGRRSLAAIATSSIILAIVLLPLFLVLFVAVGQLTSVVSRTDLDDVKDALHRGRQRVGLEVEHADRFRRLQELSGLLDQIDRPALVIQEVEEATELIRFLEVEVSGESPTGETGDIAMERLASLSETAGKLVGPTEISDPAERIAVQESFHRQSLVASAAISSWVNAKLGGAFKTQVKMWTNPSERDLSMGIRAAREYIQPRFFKLSGFTGKVFLQVVIGLLIMVIATYFFFVDGPGMVHTLMRLSPLDDEYERRLLGEFERTSRAVVLASVLSAVVQGLLAAIAFFFCGFESFILLFLITSIMALVPFLGAASVWLPCAIYLAAVDQRYIPAVLLMIYGALVVSTIDNVIKAFVLHGHSELHPLVALLSVLGGVPVFGPIGILVGPMVVVFLQTLLEILNHELELRDVVEGDEVAEGGKDGRNVASTQT